MVQSILDLLRKSRRHLVLRIYRISDVQGRLRITLTAWTDRGEVLCDEIECDTGSTPGRMVQAVEHDVITADQLRDQAFGELYFTWLPVSRESEPFACIELGMTRPLTYRQLITIDGMRGLYGNFLDLLHYSQVDTLTRLLNRKTFDDSLLKMLAKSAETSSFSPDRRLTNENQTNWLAVMDIDHFKRINDTFGHLFGDEVLIHVANLMRTVFRGKDKLFRFGGEEFVVLLRNTGSSDAGQVFERFRLAIENHNFPQVENVTISIGVASARNEDTPTTLLARADEALYYAKRNGRNQVQFFDHLVDEGKIEVKSAVMHTEAELF